MSANINEGVSGVPLGRSSSTVPSNLAMESSALVSDNEECEAIANGNEPTIKKIKLDEPSSSSATALIPVDKSYVKPLEQRLEEILCCVVCLDLPKLAMYQCQMGHLMCAVCFAHLLADGRIRNSTLTCPNCRIEVDKNSVTRNRAVEKIAFELPSQCHYCKKDFLYKNLSYHEKNICTERPNICKYAKIGCTWIGAFNKTEEHEKTCVYPNKTGQEVLHLLMTRDIIIEEQMKEHKLIMDMLNTEQTVFLDVKMEAVRLYVNSSKLSYETKPFTAFDQKWLINAHIKSGTREAHQSNDRYINYQLVLWTEITTPMSISYCALKGPFSDLKIIPHVYKHDFGDRFTESPYTELPLHDSNECNRLLSDESFYLRIFMVVNKKKN